jgi:glutamate-1-semialdehyde 2,1-aminomutase
METTGLPALTSFSFTSAQQQAYKTLITKEMLKKGILAATSVYVCLSHTAAEIARYFEVLDKVFVQISRHKSGLNPHDLIRGTLAQTGFKRLN